MIKLFDVKNFNNFDEEILMENQYTIRIIHESITSFKDAINIDYQLIKIKLKRISMIHFIFKKKNVDNCRFFIKI